MELTEDALRVIAKHMVDLSMRLDAIEVMLTQELGGNPRHLDTMIRKAHEAPGYQLIWNQVFQQLKVNP